MQYLSDLPVVSSIGVDDDIIELELEEEIEELPDRSIIELDPIVLTAIYAGWIIVTVGQVIAHENIEGPDGVWSRIKIKGSSSSFTI